MRKYISIFAGIAYLSLANFCSLYAAVTGHAHSPDASACESRHCSGHDAHDEQDEHDEGALPCHHDSHSSGSCCTRLTQDTPVLLEAVRVEMKPFVLVSWLTVLPAENFADGFQPHQLFRDHDPPGLSSSEIARSLLSPRSPPSFVSL